MGHASRVENITLCLAALDGVLSDMGAEIHSGAALPAAERLLAQH